MKHPFLITSFKKILVTGGEGTMGNYVANVFNKSGVFLASKNILDVTKKKQVIHVISDYKPDLIIHLASITDVDFCETHQTLAEQVNFGGTRNIVFACKTFNIPFVYISTATVFDGNNAPKEGYTENDTPSPITVYGKTKLEGEKIIKKHLDRYIIVRIGWLIGGAEKEKKFISLVRNKIERGETVRAVNDIFGTISYAQDVWLFIKEKLEKREFGLYHFACQGVCSRFDMAKILKEMINPKATIIPVSVKDFHKQFPAPRPKMQIIRSVKHSFNKPWDVVLKQYISSELIS